MLSKRCVAQRTTNESARPWTGRLRHYVGSRRFQEGGAVLGAWCLARLLRPAEPGGRWDPCLYRGGYRLLNSFRAAVTQNRRRLLSRFASPIPLGRLGTSERLTNCRNAIV